MVNETKHIEGDEALLSFIKERLDTMPVLLYCSQATKDYINQSEYPYMSADGEDVDEAALRELDKRSGEG